MGTWSNAGGTTTYANYAALPAAPADGTIGHCLDTNTVWKYCSAAGLWLPPWMQPAALLVDYAAAALPEASTPAWTKGGTSSSAVAGGELTITDTGASYCEYTLIDLVNFINTKNCAMVVRLKITSEDAVADHVKAYIGFAKPKDVSSSCLLGFATGDAVGTGRGNLAMGPYNSGGPNVIASMAGSYDIDNTAYGWYYLSYLTSSDTYVGGILGSGNTFSQWAGWGSAASIGQGVAAFGAFSTARSVTIVISNLKVFNFA